MHKMKIAADTSVKYRLQLCLCESLIAGCLDNNCMIVHVGNGVVHVAHAKMQGLIVCCLLS